jgi:hypothetical protein
MAEKEILESGKYYGRKKSWENKKKDEKTIHLILSGWLTPSTMTLTRVMALTRVKALTRVMAIGRKIMRR